MFRVSMTQVPGGQEWVKEKTHVKVSFAELESEGAQSQRWRRVPAPRDKSPQPVAGFIIHRLPYNSQVGSPEAPRELPDAQRAATSSPKGACDLGLALMIRAADARDRPAAAGSQGQLLQAEQQAPERSLRNQSVGLRQGPQEAVTVGEKGKFPALARVPGRGGAPFSWDTASSAFTSSLTWQF